MHIAIINRSKLISDKDVAAMTEAVSYQLAKHVAPNWAMLPCPVIFYTSTAHLTADARPIAVLDDPDVDGALGYHTEEGGKIWGRVFVKPVLDNGGAVLCDQKNVNNTSVASVLSHEIIEMFLDPYINTWSDGPKIAEGSEYAFEGCDAVEADSYVVHVGQPGNQVAVAVSNFLLPHWFDEQSKKVSYDYLRKLNRPFSMTPGGYMVVRNGPGTERQVFGAKYPEWRKGTKTGLARTAQRKK
jgi:hypothetical protein